MTDWQVMNHVETMTDDELRAIVNDRSAEVGLRLDAALEIGVRRGHAAEAEHAAFHGVHKLRYGRVGRRRGYLGETVYLDCYYGRTWS